MITLEFDEDGEKFILETSKRMGRSPKDVVKCALAFLYWVNESVVKGGRTITLLDGSFDPYESVIVAPGDKTERPLAHVYQFPTPEKSEPAE